MLPVNRVCSTRIWSQVSPLLLAGLCSTVSHFLVSELRFTAVHYCDTFTGVWGADTAAQRELGQSQPHLCPPQSISLLYPLLLFASLTSVAFALFLESVHIPLFQPFRSLNTAAAATDQSKVKTFQWETLFNTLQHFCHLKSLTGKSLNVLSFLWHTLLFVATFNAELGVLDCIVSNLSYLWPACGACATTKPTNSTGDWGFEGDLGSSQTNWISSSEVFEERKKGKLQDSLATRQATSPHRIPKSNPFSNILWCFDGFWFLKARPLFRRHQPAAPG